MSMGIEKARELVLAALKAGHSIKDIYIDCAFLTHSTENLQAYISDLRPDPVARYHGHVWMDEEELETFTKGFTKHRDPSGSTYYMSEDRAVEVMETFIPGFYKLSSKWDEELFTLYFTGDKF